MRKNLVFAPAGPAVGNTFRQGLATASYLTPNFTPQDAYSVAAYTLSLKDLTGMGPGDNLDAVVKEAWWQCLATVDTAAGTSALIGNITPLGFAPRPMGQGFNGPLRLSSVLYGPLIDRLYGLVLQLQAQQDALVQQYGLSGSYEPRMLSISGLLLSAAWLKSLTQGGRDFVVPIHTKLDFQNRPYPLDEFVTAAKPIAQKRLTSSVFD